MIIIDIIALTLDFIPEKAKTNFFIKHKDPKNLFMKILKNTASYFDINFNINEKMIKIALSRESLINNKVNYNFLISKKAIDLFTKTFLSYSAIVVTEKNISEEGQKQYIRNLVEATMSSIYYEVFNDPAIRSLILSSEEIRKIMFEILNEIKSKMTILEILKEKIEQLEQLLSNLTRILNTRLPKKEARMFKKSIEDLTEYYVYRNYFVDLQKKVENSNGIVLLIGEPGSGKSTILAQLIKETNYLFPHYFFGKGGGREIDDAKLNLYLRAKNYLKLDFNVSDPYLELFQRQLDLPKKMVFIIDGLDEAVGNIMDIFPSEYVGFSEKLLFIVSAKTNSYAHLQLKMKENIEIIEIKSKTEEARLKTSEYIEKRAQNERFSLEKKYIDQIIDNANGNFQYVKFVLDALCKGKLSAGKLPNNYDDLYLKVITTILKDSDRKKRNSILRILSFFAIIKVPMSYESFLEIINCEINETAWTEISWLFESYISEDIKKYNYYHKSLTEFMIYSFTNGKFGEIFYGLRKYLNEAYTSIFDFYNSNKNIYNSSEIECYFDNYLIENIYNYTLNNDIKKPLIMKTLYNFSEKKNKKKFSFYKKIVEQNQKAIFSYINLAIFRKNEEGEYKIIFGKVLNIIYDLLLTVQNDTTLLLEVIEDYIGNENYSDSLKIIFLSESKEWLLGFWSLSILINENFSKKTVEKTNYPITTPLYIIDILLHQSINKSKDRVLSKCLDIINEIPLGLERIEAELLLSKYYKNTDEKEKGLNILLKTEKLANCIDLLEIRSLSFLNIAKTYYIFENNHEASKCLDKATEIAMQLDNSRDLFNILRKIEIARKELGGENNLSIKHIEKLFERYNNSEDRERNLIELVVFCSFLYTMTKDEEFLNKAKEIISGIHGKDYRTEAIYKLLSELIKSCIERFNYEYQDYLINEKQIITKIDTLLKYEIYLKLLKKCLVTGELEKIENYLEKIESLISKNFVDKNKIKNLLKVANILYLFEMEEKAIKFIEKAIWITKEIESSNTRDFLLLEILETLICLRNNISDKYVKDIVNYIEKKSIKNFAKVFILNHKLEMIDNENSKVIMGQIESLIHEVDDFEAKIEINLKLAKKNIEIGQNDNSKKFLEKAKKETININEITYRNLVVLEIVKFFLDTTFKFDTDMYIETIKQIISIIKEPHYKNKALLHLVKFYGKISKKRKKYCLLNQARSLVEKIDSPFVLFLALKEISTTYLELKNEKESLNIMKEGEDTLGEIKNPYNLLDSFLSLSKYYNKIKRNEETEKFLENAKNILKRLKNDEYSDEKSALEITMSRFMIEKYCIISLIYNDMGNKKQSEYCIKEVKEEYSNLSSISEKINSLLDLAYIYNSFGNNQKALSFVEEVENKYSKILRDQEKIFILLRISDLYFLLGNIYLSHDYIKKATVNYNHGKLKDFEKSLLLSQIIIQAQRVNYNKCLDLSKPLTENEFIEATSIIYTGEEIDLRFLKIQSNEIHRIAKKILTKSYYENLMKLLRSKIVFLKYAKNLSHERKELIVSGLRSINKLCSFVPFSEKLNVIFELLKVFDIKN